MRHLGHGLHALVPYRIVTDELRVDARKLLELLLLLCVLLLQLGNLGGPRPRLGLNALKPRTICRLGALKRHQPPRELLKRR